VIHPSQYATARIGYLRGADLSQTKSTAGRRRSRTARRSSLAGAASMAGRRRRSTLGGMVAGGRAGRRRSSVGAGHAGAAAADQDMAGDKRVKKRRPTLEDTARLV